MTVTAAWPGVGVELALLDDDYDGTGTTAVLVRLVQGTPAATPTVPNSPDGNALPLYRIAVPPGSGLLPVTSGVGYARSLRDTLASNAGIWDRSLPVVRGTGDVLSVHGTYETAS
ncbi:hypothetical protein OG496_33655 [Streptomyces sp. NBC_00988]|uniref:hypothetical protein n=1 Tax=Streptomyces sp. NBC_00988 TaxID=2903704 RepID=UPI00386CEFA5|nr:hypothetical protein OG496_33655 [Streptomyces sp. NBC_00988]